MRFHGCTLWTDFSIFGSPINYGMLCQEKMNDYKRIKRDPTYSKLRSIDVYQIHQKSMRWLEQSLSESSYEKNVVITHHAPSLQSVPKQYQKDPVTAAYASNLESFIIAHQPLYWIHGHIHTPIQYNIGNTQIICNPHGYIDDKENGFERELFVEV